MKVLLITSRNVYGTSGELRLIKNRTETLLQSYEVETDILLFKKDRVLRNNQEKFGFASFDGIFYNWRNHVLQFKKFLNLVRNKIQGEEYDAIIVSGGFIFFNMPRHIKKQLPQSKLIVDVHGTIEELKEFAGRSFLQKVIRRVLFSVFNREQKSSFQYADGFFVVSSSLKEYVNGFLQNGKKAEFFIVPCGIKETEIDKEKSLEYRRQYRDKYRIGDNELLFVYSGGVSPWQCIEESVALFKGYSEKAAQRCKMLILSGNIDYINKFQCDNIITDSYSGDEVRKVLCAGDYAFLLRGDYRTNHVAYPNKFLEYVASGMCVIATENVDDVAAQVRKYSIGTIVNFDDSLQDKLGTASFEYLSDISNRNALLLATSFKTTLKPFVEFLKS